MLYEWVHLVCIVMARAQGSQYTVFCGLRLNFGMCGGTSQESEDDEQNEMTL